VHGLELAWDEARLRAFYRAMPDLFRQAQAPVHEAYQRLLYTVEHPLSESTTDAIEAAFGLAHPSWNPGSRQQAIQMLDRMRYPATAAIGGLRSVAGLDLRILSHYLHFFHHAYPIYDRASCAGLERLGVPMPYVKVRDPGMYGIYIAAVEHLKEHAPYWSVPETNVYLTRIVQGALSAYGQAPAAPGANGGPASPSAVGKPAAGKEAAPGALAPAGRPGHTAA
jgi:hypothetical protein